MGKKYEESSAHENFASFCVYTVGKGVHIFHPTALGSQKFMNANLDGKWFSFACFIIFCLPICKLIMLRPDQGLPFRTQVIQGKQLDKKTAIPFRKQKE